MDPRAVVDVIENQEWLEPVADTVQNAVGKAFEAAGEKGKAVEDFLHGVWVGHPLHPILTDLPLGAWTVGVFMDLLDMAQGREDLSTGADAAIAIGVAGAVGAAATGLTDWHVLHEEQRPKKVGMTHALVNTAALALFGTSLLLRKKEKRAAGRAVGFLGYATAIAGAYLGGTLVYEEEVGVDHAQRKLPEGWIPVMEAKKLKEGEMTRVDVRGMKVLVAKQNGRILAIGEVCSHLGGPLSEGKMEDACVTCPWHGSTFSLEDGAVVNGPATLPQETFATRVNEGKIEVRARHGG